MVRGAPLASASLNYAAVSHVCKYAFSASFAQKKTPAAENKEPSQEFDWRPEANAELLQFAVAILKALAGTTRAGIVTADMREVEPLRLVVLSVSIRKARFAGFLTCLSSLLSFFGQLDLNMHKHTTNAFAHGVKQRFEHGKRFALVFLLGLLLSVTAQIDALTQCIERSNVLSPRGVEHLQQHISAREHTCRV